MTTLVVEDQHILVMDMALRATLARATHKESFVAWAEVQLTMQHIFVPLPSLTCNDVPYEKCKQSVDI
jgi:hypothetical protein|uniref:Uncharacterized protein n=2 Tax=Picea TaxID=3328 RepID=A0A101M047_PICGL|nr:hypothetical protein ABT39_MTgene4550 [Picea glauca]QHR87864.1 hypothetical protein Q903MT_gene1876 [Picea sitchensis]QHR92740.1 hypothetical protein Q903MT_gene6788 [Picea sitchensis]